MAKRFLLVSALAAFVAGGVFAQMPQMSVGAGYIQNRGSIGGLYNDNYVRDGVAGFTSNRIGLANQNGGFVFFDATYGELAIGLMHTLLGYKVVHDTQNNSGSYEKADTSTLYYLGSTALAMDISLLGKYPVAVGKMTVFPLLGVGYNMTLSQKNSRGKKEEFKNDDGTKQTWANKDEKKAADWSTFRIQLGAGADFDVTDRIFVRTQGLAQYRFAAKAYSKADIAETDNNTKSKGGFGGSFTIAVGYKF